jgi:hypothetical protein
MSTRDEHDETATYSPYTAVAAEGARIAVVTCLRCGAMVMLDPDVSHELAGQVLHDAWHEEVRSRLPRMWSS